MEAEELRQDWSLDLTMADAHGRVWHFLTKLIVGPDAENSFETYFTHWLTDVHAVQHTPGHEQR